MLREQKDAELSHRVDASSKRGVLRRRDVYEIKCGRIRDDRAVYFRFTGQLEVSVERVDDPGASRGKARERVSSFPRPDEKRPVEVPMTEARLPSGKKRVVFGPAGDTRWWVYRRKVYVTDPDLDADDVLALLHESENRKRLKLEKAHAVMAMNRQLDERARRQPIPQPVKQSVWIRDGGRCVECSSQANLEFDHIIPLAMGGSNTDRNLQLLCADCNRRKGATLG